MNAPSEIEVTIRFLNRFADLMSNGSNAENLLKAANLLETSVKRADEAEAQLAQAYSKCADLKGRLTALSQDAHLQVPVAILRLTTSQFEAMARAFEKSGDVVSQAMCEASASILMRILEANAARPVAANVRTDAA